MMQSQALATLVIIRQIDKPACDLGYTPRIFLEITVAGAIIQ